METPTKEALIVDLEKCFSETIDWIKAQPEENFNKELLPGKWTIAGHLYHLIKSTKAVSKGMGNAKIVLKTMFGKNNRQERSFKEMLDKYNEVLSTIEVKVPSSYEAEKGRAFDRTILIERFKGELNDLIKVLNKWKEKDLSVYILPHPALGKCTLREFIYFTIFHTQHHLAVLKEKYAV